MALEKQKPFMYEPLLKPAPEDGHEEAWLSPVTIIGFALLTFNSAMAVFSCSRDFGAVAFVVSAYMDLAMIFYCQRLYERTPPGLPRRDLLKMAMWVLAAMHFIAFLKLLEFWSLTIGSNADNPIVDSPK